MNIEEAIKEKVEKTLKERNEHRKQLEYHHFKYDKLRRNLKNYVSVWKELKDDEFKRKMNSSNNSVTNDEVYKKLLSLESNTCFNLESMKREEYVYDYKNSAMKRIVERKMNVKEYNFIKENSKGKIIERIKNNGLMKHSYVDFAENNFLI